MFSSDQKGAVFVKSRTRCGFRDQGLVEELGTKDTANWGGGYLTVFKGLLSMQQRGLCFAYMKSSALPYKSSGKYINENYVSQIKINICGLVRLFWSWPVII